jgi:hypothetical protein
LDFDREVGHAISIDEKLVESPPDRRGATKDPVIAV